MNATQANAVLKAADTAKRLKRMADWCELMGSLPIHFIYATSPATGYPVLSMCPVGPSEMPLEFAVEELKDCGHPNPLIVYKGRFYDAPCEIKD